MAAGAAYVCVLYRFHVCVLYKVNVEETLGFEIVFFQIQIPMLRKLLDLVRVSVFGFRV